MHSSLRQVEPGGGATGPREKVLVGMSGGTDSTAAVLRLRRQGYEVAGLTIRVWKGSGCCSLTDEHHAAEVARRLGIEHVVVDAMDEFGRRVVQPFVEEYARGRTPSPCVVCNAVIKFAIGLAEAERRGCAWFATGHYARIRRESGGCELLRGAAPEKDQSYFLHRLTASQLQRALFPVGDLSKEDCRRLVEQHGLADLVKKENHEICFVPDGDYAAFVEKFRPDLRRTGEIVDLEGRVLGRHEGFHRFTIGQRKGLAVAAGERRYVVALDPPRNRVVVGPREAAMAAGCVLEEVNWVSGVPPAPEFRCSVQLRHQHPPAPARVIVQDGTRAVVRFDEPQFGIAPGQAGVLYRDEVVLGGGWIAGTGKAAAA